MTEFKDAQARAIILKNRIKMYRTLGLGDGVTLQLSDDNIEALEAVLDHLADQGARADDIAARLRASQEVAHGVIACANRTIDRIRAEAIGIVAWVLILSLASVAWALAITAGLGL